MRAGSFNNGPDYDFSLGDTLLCYSMESGEYSNLDFEYPINIAESGKGTLLILAFFPDEGYYFMEYNPKNGSTKQKVKLDHYKFNDFAVCNNGNSLLYDYVGNSRGLVLADFDNLDLEIDIYMDSLIAVLSDSKVWYENGKVYLEDASSQKLVGFPLDNVQKKNRTVQLIATSELSYIAPYGCGYALERQEEDWDKIALKVLAQDQDYDLYMGSSSYARGLAIRDSDVLCSLNDVPGIEEYFDRCFPYVREAATTESGKIWMLPFSSNVYAMLVHEERAAQQGLNLHDHMTFTEFVQFVEGLSEEEKGMFYLYPKEIGDDILGKYFGHYTSVQEKTFLDYMEGLRVLYQKENLLNPPGDVNQEILLCTIEPFGRFPISLSYMGREGFSVYNIPKGKDLDKNNVTLYYLAVNKKSKYKEGALSYLTDLIAYLMKQDELLIFKDYKTEAGSREEQTHKLFENGEVFFAIDEDVYQKDYVDVLKSNQSLEEYAKEIDRRLQLYLKE
jgi:sulfur transfer complex TusBCD TusB component (DsrH family)